MNGMQNAKMSNNVGKCAGKSKQVSLCKTITNLMELKYWTIYL